MSAHDYADSARVKLYEVQITFRAHVLARSAQEADSAARGDLGLEIVTGDEPDRVTVSEVAARFASPEELEGEPWIVPGLEVPGLSCAEWLQLIEQRARDGDEHRARIEEALDLGGDWER
jgi:hypothetical protein